jgi:hypothetical protein
MDDEDERLRVRRGAEQVRGDGTTEQLGKIVPPPVVTEAEDEERKRREDA